jgi:nitrate/TMAO reductase-like tetraheme cytochrome c subunit
MKRWTGTALLVLLAGCGAETAGTAAVQSSLKAREAEQAKLIQQEITGQLDTAQKLQQQRLEEAARAVDQASQ